MDTSCLVAAAFGEARGAAVRRRLATYDRVYAANLLEAELRAALVREGVAWTSTLVAPFAWVLPARLLSGEIGRVVSAGHLRGADVWHVACALYLEAELGAVEFVTLDEAQRIVAAAVGLEAPRV